MEAAEQISNADEKDQATASEQKRNLGFALYKASQNHGDWREMAASTALDALRGEVEELRNAFFGCCEAESVIAEAVDVAAYAAILVDVLSMEGES